MKTRTKFLSLIIALAVMLSIVPMMSVAFDKDLLPEGIEELLFPGEEGEIVDLVMYEVHLIYATESSLEGIEVVDIGDGKIAVTVPNPFVAPEGKSLLYAGFDYDEEEDEIGGIIAVTPATGGNLTFIITGEILNQIWIIAFAIDDKGTGESFTYGDLNDDGDIGAIDSILMAQYRANLQGGSFNLLATPSGKFVEEAVFIAGNVNLAGEPVVGGQDAIMLAQYRANQAAIAQGGTPPFTNTGKAGQPGTK